VGTYNVSIEAKGFKGKYFSGLDTAENVNLGDIRAVPHASRTPSDTSHDRIFAIPTSVSKCSMAAGLGQVNYR